MSKLALLGGTSVMAKDDSATAKQREMFHWPIVNDAMREAQLKVLEDGNMSGTDITKKFEEEFAAWQGRKYALAHNTGTNALWAAMYGIGLGPGDEIICPSVTYWASCTSALTLGATVVFADIDPTNLQLDPASFEAHITPRTKAVVVVHYMAHPSDMDAIMAIARKHGIKVIEDVSHAQGGLYKGRKLGTFGDVAAMSLMSGKSFAIGEGGILVTDDYEVYRRAIRFGHYERIPSVFSKEEYAATDCVPFGGQKFRMHQVSSAIGREQLKKYDREMQEIEAAALYFWKGIEDIDGLTKIYPKWENSTKAGWYASRFLYDSSKFGGLSNITFAKALNAEMPFAKVGTGANFPLHRSSVFSDVDIFGHGKATANVYLPEGVTAKALTGTLPVAESINPRLLGEPYFKHLDTAFIDQYVEIFHKVAENYKDLLPIDEHKVDEGGIALTHRKG